MKREVLLSMLLGLALGSLSTATYYRGHPYWVNLDNGAYVNIENSKITAFGALVTATGDSFLAVSASSLDNLQFSCEDVRP